jgi:hypothetical protein|tara:strand:- start:3927 stop:5069 length:1143 start_codon:yes stop_codon:yes gene_type:complete
VPSIEKKAEFNFLFENIVVQYDNKQIRIHLYDTPLGRRFIEALKDNLEKKRILEKNFCFLGWADSKRNLSFLCSDLNKHIAQINSFKFDPPYEYINPFTVDDFQFSSRLKVGLGPEKETPGLRLKHDACNLLHRYFEELQGTAWKISDFYKQADNETKYAIRQLNNICHEIESWVLSYRKSVVEPEWMRPSQITTFLNAPRHDLHQEDYELFKQNRYDREMGGVYLHWSQVGKTLFEVYRDEHAPVMTEALCSEINHQKYYSGEFDIEWGDTITENTHDFKKQEMDDFRKWLKQNNYDWDDPKLSLGYIKIGQVDMKIGFQNKPFTEVYHMMKDNLNIKSIHTIGSRSWENVFPYTLDSDDWKEMQIKGLKRGYESRSMR